MQPLFFDAVYRALLESGLWPRAVAGSGVAGLGSEPMVTLRVEWLELLHELSEFVFIFYNYIRAINLANYFIAHWLAE